MGFDEVAAEDLAGGEVGDGDVVVVGEREDAFAGVFGADAEVVHSACSAEAHFAFVIEPVVAQPVVAWWVSVAGWERLGCGSVGVSWRASVKRAVRALLVVVCSELVELTLQLCDACGGCSGPEPALLGLVEALGLALGLWVPRGPVLLLDPEQGEHVLERVAPAGEAGGVDTAVIGERARRRSVLGDRVEEHAHHRVPGDRLMGAGGQQVAGVVVKLDEAPAGGPRALDERELTLAKIAVLIERARARAAVDAPTPDIPTEALFGGLFWVLAPLLRRGEPAIGAIAKPLKTWIDSYAEPSDAHRRRTLDPAPELPPSPHISDLPRQAPAPLLPGRPRISAAEVARNQRDRILYATAAVAAEKGYTAATIADIADAAKLDRRVFYHHFPDKRQAFLTLHEFALRHAMTIAAGAFFSAPTWPERVWAGLRASC